MATEAYRRAREFAERGGSGVTHRPNGGALDLVVQKSGVRVSVSVPESALEWFANAELSSSGSMVSDWCDYEGYDNTPAVQLERQMAEDVVSFVNKLIERHLHLRRQDSGEPKGRPGVVDYGQSATSSSIRASRLTSSWSGPSYGVASAPHVRHFIVHTRRAGHVVARPLNCGVRQQCHVHLGRRKRRPTQSMASTVSGIPKISSEATSRQRHMHWHVLNGGTTSMNIAAHMMRGSNPQRCAN